MSSACRDARYQINDSLLDSQESLGESQLLDSTTQGRLTLTTFSILLAFKGQTKGSSVVKAKIL